MLVLTRKKNQSIIIDNTIEVFVVEISNEQVKLGFKAPKNVQILRSEIHEKVIQEMEVAASSNPDMLGKLKKKVLSKHKLREKKKFNSPSDQK